MKTPVRAEGLRKGVRNKPGKLKDVKAAERARKRDEKRARRQSAGRLI